MTSRHTMHSNECYPHLEYPHDPQVMHPSTMRKSNWPQLLQACPRWVSKPTTCACGSDFRPNPSPAINPVAIMCCSITPPIAARIDGMYLPCIHAPPRGSNTAFSSSTTKDTSPPRRNTAEIIRVSATVHAKCSIFLELMKTSNGRRCPFSTMSLIVIYRACSLSGHLTL